MYAWLWAVLPGPVPVKVVLALVLLVGLVALLFLVVFPWAEQTLPFLDVTVDE